MRIVINLKSTRDPIESLLPAILILRRVEPSLIGYYLSKDCFHIVFRIDNQITSKKYFSDLKTTHQTSFKILGIDFDSWEKYQSGKIKSIETLLDLYFQKILADNNSPRRALTQGFIAEANSYKEFLGEISAKVNTDAIQENIIDNKFLQYLRLVRMVDLAQLMDISALTIDDLVFSVPVFETESTTGSNERATTIIVLTAHATHLNSITNTYIQKLLKILAHYNFKPETEVEVGPVGVTSTAGSGDLVIAVRTAIPTQLRAAFEMKVFYAIQGHSFNGSIALAKVIYLNQEPITHVNPDKIDQGELHRTIAKFNAEMFDVFFGERAEGDTPFTLPAPLYPRLISKLGTLPANVSADFVNRYYRTVLRDHFLRLDSSDPATLVSRMMLFMTNSKLDKHSNTETLLDNNYFKKISAINFTTDLQRELQIICQICCYATHGADRSNIMATLKDTVKAVLKLGPVRLKNYDAIAFRLAELYFSTSALALSDINKQDTSGLVLFAELIENMNIGSFERLYLVAWVFMMSVPFVNTTAPKNGPDNSAPENIDCFGLHGIIQKLPKNKWHHLFHLHKLILEQRVVCSIERRREMVIAYKPIWQLYFSNLTEDKQEQFVLEQLKYALDLATSASDETAAFKFLAECCCFFLDSLPIIRFSMLIDIFVMIVTRLLALKFEGNIAEYYSYLEKIRLLFYRFDELNIIAVVILNKIDNTLMFSGIQGNTFRDFVNCVIHNSHVRLFMTDWKIHAANWLIPPLAVASHNFVTFLKLHRLGHSLCFKDRPYQINPAVRALAARPNNTNNDAKLILKYLEDDGRYKDFNDGTTLAHMKAYQGDRAYFETNQSKYFVTDENGISPEIIFSCFHLNRSNVTSDNASQSTIQTMEKTLIERIKSPKPLNQQRAILALATNFLKQLEPRSLGDDVALAILNACQSITTPIIEDILFEIQMRLEFLSTQVFSVTAGAECWARCYSLINHLLANDNLSDEVYYEVFRWLFDMYISLKEHSSSISSLDRLNLLRDVISKIKNKSQSDYQSLMKIACQIAELDKDKSDHRSLVIMLVNCINQLTTAIEASRLYHETNKCVFMILIYAIRNYTQLNNIDLQYLLNLQRPLISIHPKIFPRSEASNKLFLEALSHIFITLVLVNPSYFTEPANTLTVINTWINKTGILVTRHAEMIIDGITAAVDSNTEFSASNKKAIEKFKSILEIHKSKLDIQKLLAWLSSLENSVAHARKPPATAESSTTSKSGTTGLPLPTDYQPYHNNPAPALFTPKPSNRIQTSSAEKGWLRRLFITVKADLLLHAGIRYHFKVLKTQIQLVKNTVNDQTARSLELRAYALHLFSLINLINAHAETNYNRTEVSAITNKVRNYIGHGISALDLQILFLETARKFAAIIEAFNSDSSLYEISDTVIDTCEEYFTALARESISTLSKEESHRRFMVEMTHLKTLPDNSLLDNRRLIDIAVSCTILGECMNDQTPAEGDIFKYIKEISTFVSHSINTILCIEPKAQDYDFEGRLRTLVEPLLECSQSSTHEIKNSR